jgi:hypothetical protein
MLRFAAAAATSLALLITASGCGGNDPPPPKAEPTSTPTTPAASESPTPPALPAAAKGDGARSAKAFVRHYIAVLNYATYTGDVTELRRLGAKDCGSCQNVIRGIRSIYEAGGSVKGGAFRITNLDALEHPDSSGYTVDAFTKFSKQRIYRQSGSTTPDRYKTGSNIFSFILARRHGWLVSDWSKS